MNTPIHPRPSVPSGCEATDPGGGQTCDAEQGAENPWIRTSRRWNLHMATFNTRTFSIEASLKVLFEELKGIKWDVIGISEVRKTGEAFTVLKNRHVLCYRCLVDKRELGVRSLVKKSIAGNMDKYYSINERAAEIVYMLNDRYKLKVVQGYAPIHPATTTS